MTTIIKTILGLGAAYAVLILAGWIADHMTDGLAAILFFGGLASLIIWLGRWLHEAVEAEGDGNAHM